jgi:hypothetical protein
MTASAYYLAPFTRPGGALHAAVCLLASLGAVAAGIVADRIWEATVAPALGLAPGARATILRYPFRLLAGGVAVTLVMLAAKRADLLWVADVPVKDIFATGAALAAGYHLIRDTRLHRWGARPVADGNRTNRRNR